MNTGKLIKNASNIGKILTGIAALAALVVSMVNDNKKKIK